MTPKPENEEGLSYAQQVAVSKVLQKIARQIDKELRKAAGTTVPFSLYTWGGQRTQYVSNANRDDVKKGMQELFDRWNEAEPPPHKMN